MSRKKIEESIFMILCQVERALINVIKSLIHDQKESTDDLVEIKTFCSGPRAVGQE